MPLTIAHPAIVLPLRKAPSKFFSLSGLIIGSMSPDFEYLLAFNLQDKIAHSVFGILLFCLPVGLLVYCLYHGIIRNPLIHNLPISLKGRFLPVLSFDYWNYLKERWYVVFYSIILGALSHLIWDSFTHEHRFFVEHISLLRSSVGKFPVYKLLQHSSTLLGLIYICVCVYKLPVSQANISSSFWKYWLIVGFVIALVFLVRFNSGLTLKQFGNCVVTLFSSLFMGIFTASASWLISNRMTSNRINT
ncbi:MAG: DUF4184 family protein [Fluviicola sp.]